MTAATFFSTGGFFSLVAHSSWRDYNFNTDVERAGERERKAAISQADGGGGGGGGGGGKATQNGNCAFFLVVCRKRMWEFGFRRLKFLFPLSLSRARGFFSLPRSPTLNAFLSLFPLPIARGFFSSRPRFLGNRCQPPFSFSSSSFCKNAVTATEEEEKEKGLYGCLSLFFLLPSTCVSPLFYIWETLRSP